MEVKILQSFFIGIVLLFLIGISIWPSWKKRLARDFKNFRLKKYTLSNSEQALYINLQKALAERYIVLAKVRIEDFIEVRSVGISKSQHFVR